LAGREGLSGFGVLKLPLLLLVLLVGLDETDLVFLLPIHLGHGQGLVGGGGDDLVGVPLSLDWGEFPLSWGAVGWVVHLGDGLAISVVNDHLNLTLFPLVEGKTVEFIIPTALSDEDLVPGLFGVLVVADDGGLVLPGVDLLASSAVIKNLLVVNVLDVDLGLTAKDGGSTGGLLLVLDALLLGVVPVLGLWALVLAPHAVGGVAVQVLLAAVGGGGLVVHVLLVAVGVWGWVSLATFGGSLVPLAFASTLALSQESSVAGLLRGGGRG